jgi:hypothetical protein
MISGDKFPDFTNETASKEITETLKKLLPFRLDLRLA